MDIDQIESLPRRAAVHAALADVTRLRIVDLLAGSDASASELGQVLGTPSNLLAHHVKVLEQAGLVTRRRSEGDARRSYLSLQGAGAAADLTGRPGAPGQPPGRVLFVCTANTARSHLAAALWRTVSPVRSACAGTHPGDRINPGAVAVANRRGLELPQVPPRPLTDALLEGDLVITVCDRAHEELSDHGWAHWSVLDPVAVGVDTAFEAAYDDLAARVHTLATSLADAS